MIDFVGAGPGAADLITVRGKRLIEEADVIIYAGSLVNPDLLVRYLNLTVNHVVDENAVGRRDEGIQLDMFTDYEAVERQKRAEAAALAKERRLQEAQLAIKRKFGKNAILKGTSFEEGATAIERNRQIGGHKA